MKRRRTDGVVVERPQGGVGEPEIELLVFVGCDGYRLEPDTLVLLGCVATFGTTQPANPESIATLEN